MNDVNALEIKTKPSLLFEEFLTAKMNQEYYAQRLDRTKKKSRNMDIYLAMFAGGSGIAAFGIWQVQIGGIDAGKMIFAALACVGVVIGILKPYLKLDDEIERLSSIQGAYAILAHHLEDLITVVSSSEHGSGLSEEKFTMIRAIKGSLEAKEDKPANEKLAQTCQKIIRTRYSDKVKMMNNFKANRK